MPRIPIIEDLTNSPVSPGSNLLVEYDAVFQFKFEEAGEEVKSLVRIMFMRNVGFDSRWHSLRMNDNFEVTLEKLGAG